MSSRERVTEPSSICPACNTRLRVSPREAAIPNFHCPECDTALAADRGADQTVVLRVIPAETPVDRCGFSLLQRSRCQHSRLIAFVVAASIGWTLVMLTVPDVESEGRRRRHVEFDSDAQSTSNQDVTVAVPPEQEEAPDDHRRQFSDTAPDHRVVESDAGSARSVAATDDSAGSVPASQSLKSDAALSAGLLTQYEPDGARPVAIHPQPGVVSDDESLPASEKPAEVSDDETSTEATGLKSAAVQSMTLSQRLEIPIQSFRITESLSVHEVVRLIEQMCRVEVDTSGASAGKLEREVTLLLQETTPVEILSEAARKSGLRVIVDETSVRFVSDDD